ncbi:MAG: hypothetical protein GXO25_07885 [Euryarchaeota archaeon]|nr:hypothetical protein [Euryarchaeota archaeon]
MNKWQIVGIVGAVIVIVGLFLPWATVTGTNPDTGEKISETVYGYISIGLWIFVILGLIGAVIPKKLGGILALVFGILGVLVTWFNIMGIYALKAMYDSDEIKIHMHYGGYVALLGFVILFIGGILQFIAFRKEQKAQVQPATPAPPVPPMPPQDAKIPEEGAGSGEGSEMNVEESESQ